MWASGDVGGCSGGDEGVYLAAFGGLGVKKLKWGGIFTFLVIFGVSVTLSKGRVWPCWP